MVPIFAQHFKHITNVKKAIVMAFDMFYDIAMNIYNNLTMIWRNERCGELFRNSKTAHHLRLTPIWRTSSHRSAFWRTKIWNVSCPEGNMLSGDTNPIHLKLMQKFDYCANAGALPWVESVLPWVLVYMSEKWQRCHRMPLVICHYIYIVHICYIKVCVIWHSVFIYIKELHYGIGHVK